MCHVLLKTTVFGGDVVEASRRWRGSVTFLVPRDDRDGFVRDSTLDDGKGEAEVLPLGAMSWGRWQRKKLLRPENESVRMSW
jgi:hypothetical protein